MVYPVVMWFGLSLGVVCASPGSDEREPGSLVDSAAGSTTSLPDADQPSDHATAEDVLKALQVRRRANTVISPGSARDGGGQSKRAALYPEGWALVSRSGRPVFSDNAWTFILDGADGELRLGLLANTVLEGMVRSGAGTSDALRFVVSGELTVFQGANYLLLRLALRSTAPAVDHQPPGSKTGATGDVEDEPATSTPEGPAGAERSAEDVVKALQGQSPAQRVVSSGGPAPRAASGSGVASARTLLPDGTPLVERPGRLVDEGLWWTFAFESDSPDHPEPPMKLLQNKNVELMVEASQRGELGLVFVVSGEVTAFNGDNYLLPRVVMRRTDSGNLRK